jgi:hypothetical protein
VDEGEGVREGALPPPEPEISIVIEDTIGAVDARLDPTVAYALPS